MRPNLICLPPSLHLSLPPSYPFGHFFHDTHTHPTVPYCFSATLARPFHPVLPSLTTDKTKRNTKRPLTSSDRAGFCSMASFTESNTDASVGKDVILVIAAQTTAHGVECASLDKTDSKKKETIRRQCRLIQTGRQSHAHLHIKTTETDSIPTIVTGKGNKRNNLVLMNAPFRFERRPDMEQLGQ